MSEQVGAGALPPLPPLHPVIAPAPIPVPAAAPAFPQATGEFVSPLSSSLEDSEDLQVRESLQ
jgi:hypothetical protein